MAETQQVIIEFIAETGQLDSAIAQLEKTGAIDSKIAQEFKRNSAEINKQATEIKKAAASTAPLKKNLEDVNKATKSFTKDFAAGFNEGVIETLKEAGVSVEEFSNALKTGQTEVDKSSESLRQRLKVLTQQIAEMKLAGQDNTEQFKQMVIEAGNIKDAMGDAAAEIKNAGSDTRTFDNLLGTAQAVAGGFAVAQGAAALFGDENEELQKTMLKVNAAIAITQGLQSIGAAIEKEGALSLLATNIQLKVKNAQKVIETGLESQSIIVRGAATVAQKALNAAMAANPIGILVVAVAGLITILATYGRSAAAARQQTSNLNVALGQSAKNFEERQEAIKATGENLVNALENQGERESIIAAQRLETEKQIADSRKARLKELQESQANNLEADLEKRQQVESEIRKLEDETFADGARLRNLTVQQQKLVISERLKNAVAGIEAELLAAEEGSKQQLNLQRRLIATRTALELNADGLLENEKKAIIEKGNKEREEVDAAARKREIDLQLSAIDAQLINVREGSEEELKLKKQQVELQTQAELTNTKLSEDEKLQIKKDGLEKQSKLQTDYNAKVRREAIEDQISRNEAEIILLETNNQDRLILQIANIELAAAAEVDAAKGNDAKIKEINAKRDADILATKKKFIDDALEYEIGIQESRGGASRRLNEKIVADESKSLTVRLNAINQLAAKEIESINKRQDALKDQFDQGLIGREEYNLKYAQLLDKELEAEEKTAEKKKQLIREVEEARIQFATQSALQVLDIISQFGQQQTEAEQIKIDSQRKEIKELREAGAITEKEAIARQKKLDQEERTIKRKQAERDKAIAIFTAIINTATAVSKALAVGGPVYAAIVGALGAAQIALIAARPIPKFAKGKKDRYEGPGEIGEAGMELMQHDGQLYLAKKKTLVWLGKDDKVYNPTETKEMLMPVVDKQLMQWQPPVQKAAEMDYDKLAKAMGKHINIPGFNIDEQGFKIWQQEGLSRTNYMDKRYSSK